jgi:hypothetical protein
MTAPPSAKSQADRAPRAQGWPLSLFARAVGWGAVRALIGLLAAGLLIFYVTG